MLGNYSGVVPEGCIKGVESFMGFELLTYVSCSANHNSALHHANPMELFLRSFIVVRKGFFFYTSCASESEGNWSCIYQYVTD